MDSIQIHGKEYISSKRAAEISSYTQDYIGQLARSGKIPATRIGRSWYVSEVDLLTMAGKETVTHPISNTPPTNQKSISAPTTRSLASLKGNGLNRSISLSSIRYLNDSSDLLPLVKTSVTPKVEGNSITIEHNTNQNIVRPVRRFIVHTSKDSITSPISFDGLIIDKRKPAQVRPNSSILQFDHLEKRNNQSFAVFSIGIMALVFLAVLVSGFTIPNEWAVSPSQLSAVPYSDFQIFIDIAKKILLQIWELLRSFYFVLVSSFKEFFLLGISFLLSFF